MNLGGTIRLNKTGLCILLAIFILLMFYITSNQYNDIKSDKTKEISLRQLLFTAIEAAKKGGLEIKNLKGPLDVKSKGNSKEGFNETLSAADRNSHCVMYNTLKDTFPNIRLISEEHVECRKTADYKLDMPKEKYIDDKLISIDDILVWIDPLDATAEYLNNLTEYVTTMVCVAVKGKPVIGVIHKPFKNKTSWAWVDTIHKSEDLVKPSENTGNKKIIISMSHPGKAEQTLKKAFGENIKIISAAGAGYKSLEVASGRVDAYYHLTSIKKWDICAGNAIINALAGKMTTSFNDEFDYSSMGINKIVNDKGLLATIYNHDWYIEQLSNPKY